MTNEADRNAELRELTVDIVSAFVSNDAVPLTSLPDIIASVHLSLSSLGGPLARPVESPVPAVNPRRSVMPDFIICLEDGKRFKSLKRHLRTDFGLTPDEYRAKWRLSNDYPMVAPNYSDRRSTMARSMGLGRKAAPETPVKRTL
jgi:predicted transcriptional regulator